MRKNEITCIDVMQSELYANYMEGDADKYSVLTLATMPCYNRHLIEWPYRQRDRKASQRSDWAQTCVCWVEQCLGELIVITLRQLT